MSSLYTKYGWSIEIRPRNRNLATKDKVRFPLIHIDLRMCIKIWKWKCEISNEYCLWGCWVSHENDRHQLITAQLLRRTQKSLKYVEIGFSFRAHYVFKIYISKQYVLLLVWNVWNISCICPMSLLGRYGRRDLEMISLQVYIGDKVHIEFLFVCYIIHRMWNRVYWMNPEVCPSVRPCVDKVSGTFEKKNLLTHLIPLWGEPCDPYLFSYSYTQFWPSGGQIFRQKWGYRNLS